jgi:hypothetical protein
MACGLRFVRALQPSTALVAGVVLGVLALAALGVGLGIGLTRDNDDGALLSLCMMDPRLELKAASVVVNV